jgi:hypothetical protein
MSSTPVRLDAPAANDNGSRPLSRPRDRADLASAEVGLPAPEPGARTVSVSGDRSEQAYACSGNLILPLRFARRFPGWTTPARGR